MIKKQGDKFKVMSESGKNLGSDYNTKKEALRRLSQIEFFKNRDKNVPRKGK
jgi:hypothetical protein